MDTKNRLKKLLKSEHFRKKTYNCTDFGTIIKQIFVPIPVLPKKERGIDSCDKRRNFNGTRCHKAHANTRLLHMTDSLENQANPTLFILSKSQVY